MSFRFASALNCAMLGLDYLFTLCTWLFLQLCLLLVQVRFVTFVTVHWSIFFFKICCLFIRHTLPLPLIVRIWFSPSQLNHGVGNFNILSWLIRGFLSILCICLLRYWYYHYKQFRHRKHILYSCGSVAGTSRRNHYLCGCLWSSGKRTIQKRIWTCSTIFCHSGILRPDVSGNVR